MNNTLNRKITPMSFDSSDFDPYSPSVTGEWIEMHFPVGTMPITLGDCYEADPQHYMNIQFENGTPWFMIMKTVHEQGFRSPKDECVVRFEMPTQLLERIARIGRS